MDPVTAGEVVTVIGSMAATTKTILETVKAARTKAKNPEVERGLSEALEQIFSLQSGMIDLQAQVLSLQEENARLRERLRQEEARAKERRQFQRKRLGGAVVMVREEEPDMYYCPACYESKGKAIPLQELDGSWQIFGSHDCPECSANFSLHG